MPTRKEFLKMMSAGGAAIAMPAFFKQVAELSKGSKRANIIWLDSEDNCPDIGCYGNRLVHTPNLDRLASQGARYTNAYAPSPVCSPARSAYITGMYQTTIGAQNHRSHRLSWDQLDLQPPVKPITHYFKNAGYFCSSGDFNNGNKMTHWGKTDFNFSYNVNQIYNGKDWRNHKEGQPFFAHIHFEETHRPFAPHDTDRPKVQHRIDPDEVKLPSYLADHRLLREDWALYLESWEVLDRKVGIVLRELEKAGLAKNTAIFFTGDGGRTNYRCKDWLYDGGIHIPLLVRWPGQIKAGTVDDQLINGIDLVPAWMHVAGIDPPDYLQGRDFLNPSSPQREYIFAARDRYDEIVDRIRCVRSHRYKYIRNFYPERAYLQGNLYKKRRVPAITLMPILKKEGKLNKVQEQFLAKTRPPEELYDVQSDPDEVHNLAGQPEYEHTLLFFRNKLDEWIWQTKDQGTIPEDPQVVAYWKKTMYKRYVGWMKERGLSPDISPEDYLKWWEKRDHRLTS